MKRTVSQPWRGGIAHFRFDKKTKCDKHYLSPPLCINVYRRPNTIDSPVENQHPVKRRPIHGLTFKAFRAEKAKILVLCKAKTVRRLCVKKSALSSVDETLLLLINKKTLTKVKQTYFTFMKQKIQQKELAEIIKK